MYREDPVDTFNFTQPLDLTMRSRLESKEELDVDVRIMHRERVLCIVNSPKELHMIKDIVTLPAHTMYKKMSTQALANYSASLCVSKYDVDRQKEGLDAQAHDAGIPVVDDATSIVSNNSI